MKFLFLVILLTSCKESVLLEDELHEKALKKVCNKKQLELVDFEFSICKKASYFSSYCYNMARIHHCSDSR